MKLQKLNQRIPIQWFRAAILISYGVFLFLGVKQVQVVGGSDFSQSILAGSTAILNGETYPLYQRPPLYSLFISAVSLMVDVDGSDVVITARESGSIYSLPVASFFFESPFLSVLLISQIALWIFTLHLILRIADRLSVSQTVSTIGLVLFLVPSGWRMAVIIWDAVLTQFLLIAFIYFLIRSLDESSITYFSIALVALSFTALSRAAYQLLPFLILLLLPLFDRKWGLPMKMRLQRGIVMVVIPVLFLGGWSVRNQVVNGFFGMGSSFGVSLSTRTSLFLEDAQVHDAELKDTFVQIRDDLLITSERHAATLWGELAAQWLMSEKGLSYAEANQELLRFNLNAISKAPINYILTVGQSMVGFHFPNVFDGESIVRIGLYLLDFSLISVFLFSFMLWGSSHCLGWLAPNLLRLDREKIDYIIFLISVIYLYSVFVNAAVDQGMSTQRLSVQAIISLSILLIVSRLHLYSRLSRIRIHLFRFSGG